MANGDEFEAQVHAELDALFNAAKERDECEYILSLLRARGEQAAGWEPLVESHEAIKDYLALYNGPIRDDTRVRLGLLIYSHIAEIDAVYELLANMFLVIRGDRYSMIPFGNFTEATGKPTRDPIQRIAALKELEANVGRGALASIFESFFNNKVRNAFYHSNYMIHGNEFRYFDKGIAIAISLDNVADWVERAIRFYFAFTRAYVGHRQSYTASKIISGRMAPGCKIKVLVEPGYGLVGLEASL